MTGYVPSTRRGKWQVRMQAYDSKGNAVKLQEDYAGALPYFQTEAEQDAIDIQTDINQQHYQVRIQTVLLVLMLLSLRCVMRATLLLLL